MPRSRGLGGSWILLGLGGLAAACGAVALHRFRSRPRGNPGASPETPPHPETETTLAPVADWNPERALDGLSPGGISPAGSEPWLEPLRQAMDRSPHAFGYGKSAWTAPLLARYLQDTRGLDVPLPLVRKALKDLGYRWEHTRYVQARAGALQGGSPSEGMG